MADPISLKAITDAISSFWGRSALLLWCLSACAWASWGVIFAGKHFQFDRASEAVANYGLALSLVCVVLPIIAAFKTYGERPKPSLLMVPVDGQSFWAQSTQSDGRVTTQFALNFQATNVSDHPIKLSDVKIRRPWVRRRSIISKLLTFQHPKENVHSSQYPVLAHSLTYGSATVIVDRAIGTKGKPMRVVVRLQDHTGRWRRLVFPYVTNVGA
ncbi:MAG: hypothetical protein ABR878_18740 [Roseiarcus sp.]|jgi:hypothetical protein